LLIGRALLALTGAPAQQVTRQLSPPGRVYGILIVKPKVR